MNARRYEKRPAREGVWQVVYTSTGQIVTMDGNPLDGLDKREAIEVIALLDEGELVPDPSDGP
ncbi:hypothetical protein [Chelativorans sp. YIM 93263]|uniref:hypothetical protein n=1 Tax=Chelativorans sp. YIM 93263 TaxID=2906648 RepID=UPI00237A0292|nr:hypothetical protein [Chelativorans sp. YIM 93263]